MSAQVDVLAVLDATIRAAKADAKMHSSYDAAKAAVVFEEACAAVAALIAERDALREACKEALDAGNDGDWQSARNALTRALTTGESA